MRMPSKGVVTCLAFLAWGCGGGSRPSAGLDVPPETGSADVPYLKDVLSQAEVEAPELAGPDASDTQPADPAGPEDTGAEDLPVPDEDVAHPDPGTVDPGGMDDGAADAVEDPGDDPGSDAVDSGSDSFDSGPDIPPLPQGCILGSFQPFYGNIHAHTKNSDGEGKPADAFAHARDVAHLDIQFITDHLEQLYQIPCLWEDDDWPDCNEQADVAYVPGTFISGCGFEYGTSIGGLTGHNNVFFSKKLFPCLQLYFEQFYGTLKACYGCTGQFNHPGDVGTQTWNDFQYFPDVDPRMNLFEFNSDPAWDLFFKTLDKGWHVSPVYNQDNHGADWGSKNDSRSGFWLTDLTRESLQTAMTEQRSFATTDRNATITLKTVEGCWMGSMLSGLDSMSVKAVAEDIDPGDGFVGMEFWGPGQTLIQSKVCEGAVTCEDALTVAVPAATYVFARARQTDGQYLVSAPIWATP
jgi:hypothetical protein